jgi:hypothetical protein
MIKPALSALVKPIAAAAATWLVALVPNLDPSVAEATLSAVLAGVATLLAEQAVKLKKAKAEKGE